MNSNKIKKNVLVFLISFIVFFIATYPLRNVFAVFTVTDVRPGIVFNPFLSICFGPVAALGCAFANMLGDVLSGYPTFVNVLGLVLQFIYGFVCWFMWEMFTKGTEHRFRLNSTSKLLKFTATSIVFGIVCGLGVGMFVHWMYGAHFWDTAKFVFMNNFDSVMLLGCPLMIIANLIISRKHGNKDRKPSVIESVILFAFFICIAGAGVIIYAVYKTYNIASPEVYDLWNNIYYFIIIFINIVFVSLIVTVAAIEKHIKGDKEDVTSFE